MKNTLSTNIKQLRTGMGLNQVEFAKKLNVTKQCVSNWENDNVQPSIEMLLKLAEFFKVSTDFLLGRTQSKTVDVSHLTDEQIAHLRMIIADLSD